MFPTPANPTNGIFIYNRVKNLTQKGVEFRIIAPQPKYFPMSSLISKKYAVYRQIPKKFEIKGIPVSSPKYTYLPVKYFRNRIGKMITKSLLKQCEDLKKENFSLIHAHGAIDAGVAAMNLSRKLGIPYLVTAHGSDVNLSFGNKVKENNLTDVFGNASKVIFVSEALREKAKNLDGYSGKNSVVISNGIDTDFFKQMNRSVLRKKMNVPAESKVILFVGNLLRIKGAHLLPKIFRGIKNKIPDSFFYVVGDGPLKKSMIEELSNLNILGDTVFTGRVAQEEVPIYMNLSDVLVLPSLNEGQPCVIRESLACGTPVVGSDVGGIPETIGDEIYGKTFPVGNVDKAVEAILEVLSVNWDRKKLNERVLEFSWEKVVNSEIDVYNEILN